MPRCFCLHKPTKGMLMSALVRYESYQSLSSQSDNTGARGATGQSSYGEGEDTPRHDQTNGRRMSVRL